MGSNTFWTKLTVYIENISRNNKQEIFRSLPTLFQIPTGGKYCKERCQIMSSSTEEICISLPMVDDVRQKEGGGRL